MKNLAEYINESIKSIPQNVKDAIRCGMKYGFIGQEENGELVKYGISRENIFSIIDYKNFTQKDIEDLIEDWEDSNSVKFKFETDEEWKKEGFKDPKEK